MAENTIPHEEEQVKNNKTSGNENSKPENENDKSEEEREKIKKQATLLFLQGKRSIYIRDFQAAVASLSESCMLFNSIYSEHDPMMADVYFSYGKALLEIGRSESEVLGEQMQEEGNSEDEEEDMEDDHSLPKKDNGTAKENNEDCTNGNTTDDLTSGIEQEAEGSGEKGESNKASANNESECEEINDLQLSWEYLELAKLIYSKQADTCKETAIKLAETYLCLGENGLESENYSIAIDDIKQGLELQKKHLPEVDRRIAETYYQLGIAYSLCQNYDEAIKYFKFAIDQLKKKIESLEMRQKIGDKKTADEEKDAFYTMEGEVKEIEVVVKEIEEKIKDMMECKNEVKAELVKQVITGKNELGVSSSSSAASSSSVPAKDISHLIKKKRKPDESNEENSDKKPKLDE